MLEQDIEGKIHNQGNNLYKFCQSIVKDRQVEIQIVQEMHDRHMKINVRTGLIWLYGLVRRFLTSFNWSADNHVYGERRLGDGPI